MRVAVFTLTLAVGAVLALGSPAWSDKRKDKDIAAMAKEAAVTIEQAVKTAVEKSPGTAVEAELEKKHGKTVWEVEILGADGAITEVHIDAATGLVIDTEVKGKKGKKEDKKGK